MVRRDAGGFPEGGVFATGQSRAAHQSLSTAAVRVHVGVQRRPHKREGDRRCQELVTRHVIAAEPRPQWSAPATVADPSASRKSEQRSNISGSDCSRGIERQPGLCRVRLSRSGGGWWYRTGRALAARRKSAAYPKHRDYRAHRCWEDYDDGTHLVPHREDLTPGGTHAQDLHYRLLS